MDGQTWAIMALPLLLVYFIPSILAASRQKKSKGKIFLLNLISGWTIVGWVACMIWMWVGEVEK